jgi:hypothetical protein
MRKSGIEVEYRKYRNVGHGFGLGIGTNAEGWIECALDFGESTYRSKIKIQTSLRCAGGHHGCRDIKRRPLRTLGLREGAMGRPFMHNNIVGLVSQEHRT